MLGKGSYTARVVHSCSFLRDTFTISRRSPARSSPSSAEGPGLQVCTVDTWKRFIQLNRTKSTFYKANDGLEILFQVPSISLH